MGDAYFDKLQLLLPMKGADESTVFRDYSRKKLYVYRAGEFPPYIETNNYAHNNYGSSAYFPRNDSGQQAHLRVNGIEIGTQAFTFSCWAAYSESTRRVFFNSRYANEAFSAISNSGAGGFSIDYDGETGIFTFTYGASASKITCSYNVSPYTPFQSSVKYGWGHFEVSRDESNNLRMFMNGKLFKTQASVSNSFDYKSCTVGGETSLDRPYTIWMNDAALHVGVALHTADFTHVLRRRTGYALSGTVLDDSGSGAIRTINAHSRRAPEVMATTQSDANGDYAFTDLVDDDHYVVCLDDAAGTAYNALVLDSITPT